MKIKMLQSIAGHAEPRYRIAEFSFAPGSVIEVQDDLAKAWIAGDIAIAAKTKDDLTMPVEVYTLKADSPIFLAWLEAKEAADAEAAARAQAEADAAAQAKADAEPQLEFEAN